MCVVNKSKIPEGLLSSPMQKGEACLLSQSERVVIPFFCFGNLKLGCREYFSRVPSPI